jgi:hypothetical protein
VRRKFREVWEVEKCWLDRAENMGGWGGREDEVDGW